MAPFQHLPYGFKDAQRGIDDYVQVTKLHEIEIEMFSETWTIEKSIPDTVTEHRCSKIPRGNLLRALCLDHLMPP